ncbi:YheC/YheD family protein [Cohnella zeiphila]|uniref:YheC/YheD family protein n=1 Tax=Cohnella zeiphila TaxID=2761120 RepID=A0A7X0VXT2_9BACL|nr:YheC/YheD family protein [Cohnella zeiphila]MBB6733792.1 YheC/YheD family protein [Cohnella zeiphila]
MSRSTMSSKWRKTKVLTGSRRLARHVPRTEKLNERVLGSMLRRYGMIYIKPIAGSLGVGVMKVERIGAQVRIHAGTRKTRHASSREAYRWILRHKRKGTYLAQKGIRTLRHRGRPVDFRVVVQRNYDKGRAWEITGMLARVAHPRKAVTNASQGGRIHPVPRLLAGTVGRSAAGTLLRRFRGLARTTAGAFGRAFPAMNELGLDIAVDRKLRCWILEVNTRPDLRPFSLLPDRAVLKRMLKLARGYGRTVRHPYKTDAKRG